MMKRILLLSPLVLLISGTVSAQEAVDYLSEDYIYYADYYSEWIEKFEVDIQVNEDASIDVVEKILYNFGKYERHGILREIPIIYGEYEDEVKLDFKVAKVTDGNGEPYLYEDNDYLFYKELKIGDPDSTITGEHWYYIYYSVDNVINAFEDYDELYWNATGTEWDVPIKEAEVHVKVPSGGKWEFKNAACYTGGFGESWSNCTWEIVSDDEYVFEARDLDLYSGLTVVAGFEKGLIEPPGVLKIFSYPWGAGIYINDEYATDSYGTFRLDAGEYVIEADMLKYVGQQEKVILKSGETVRLEFQLERSPWAAFLEFYLPALLLLIVSIGLFSMWRAYGRDPEGRGTIMPLYKPPEALTPGEAGVLADEKAHLHDITASVINLAVKGYLKITKKEEKSFLWGKDYDFIFEKLKTPADGEVLPFEKKIFNGIFYSSKKKEVRLSGLQKKFYKDLADIKEELYDFVVKHEYFKKSPDKVRSSYRKWGCLSIFIFFVIALFSMSLTQSFWYLLFLPLTGLEFFILASFMPKKTEKGTKIYEEILGFKMFLKATQKDRLRVLFSPKEYQGVFEKFLPYAIVLGVEKQWMKQFEGLYEGLPKWYAGTKGETMAGFMRDVAIFNSVAERSFVVRPSGGGKGWKSSGWGSGWSGGSSSWGGGSGSSGGFSGGGFGGGGGGSW